MAEAARSIVVEAPGSMPGASSPVPIIAVLGATDGVGRTTVASLLARAFDDVGHDRVLAIDLDAERRGVASTLASRSADAAANGSTSHRSRGRCAGIDVLAPRARDAASFDDPANGPGLVGMMADVVTRYGAVVIDTPADFGWPTQATLRVATAVVLVATPSPDGIASVVLTARRLARVSPGRVAWIVVNQATPRAARATFAAIEDCCAALNGGNTVELRFLGAVASDVALARAASTRVGLSAMSCEAWNLAAARRAAVMLKDEVWS